MIVLIETKVGLSLHVLSDHIGSITGIHYKVNNLINPPAFAGTAYTYFILIVFKTKITNLKRSRD